MEKKQISVILLKTSDQTSNELPERIEIKDRYVEFLTNNAENRGNFISIEQINLLSIDQVNNFELSEKCLNLLFKIDNLNSYRCLILSSRHSVESFESAVFKLKTRNLNDFKLNTFIVYCVGEQTANKFKGIIENFKQDKDLRYFINENFIEIKVTDREKQNSLELSKLIIEDFYQNPNEEIFALYPCSSIRKDDLSNELKKYNIPLNEITTYKTGYSAQGLEKLNQSIESNKDLNSVMYLVFFSPSGADAIFKESNTIAKCIRYNKDVFKIVSVGPSTTKRLKEYLENVDIYQMAQPSPHALLDILIRS